MNLQGKHKLRSILSFLGLKIHFPQVSMLTTPAVLARPPPVPLNPQVFDAVQRSQNKNSSFTCSEQKFQVANSFMCGEAAPHSHRVN
eukprot:1159675-Pelagomonas_calceolata.AAC.7